MLLIVYKVTNLINGKCYVGQTKRTLNERWYGHCTKAGCTALHNAILKYGKENFSIEVIDTAVNESELNSKEKYWISELNTLSPNGYNLKTGGDRSELVEDSIDKIRTTVKSLWDEGAYTAPWKRMVCQYSLDGTLIETWDSIREAAKHLGITDKHISSVCKGDRRTSGGFMWRYYEDTLGEPIELPSRKKNPQKWLTAHCKQVDQFDKDGNFIRRWESISQASTELNISSGQLTDTCKGKHKSAGGFVWKYV